MAIENKQEPNNVNRLDFLGVSIAHSEGLRTRELVELDQEVPKLMWACGTISAFLRSVDRDTVELRINFIITLI